MPTRVIKAVSPLVLQHVATNLYYGMLPDLLVVPISDMVVCVTEIYHTACFKLGIEVMKLLHRTFQAAV